MAQNEALMSAMDGVPLAGSLGILADAADVEAGDGCRSAFYVVDADGARLHHVAGMRTDAAKPGGGDEDDPCRRAWTELARAHGYGGCWAFPIATAAGRPAGVFAQYLPRPREPDAADLDRAAAVTRAAASIVARHRENEERTGIEAALREAEIRQTFLLDLSDALRPLTDGAAIERVAVRLLGERLGADRVFYASVDADGDHWSFRQGYSSGAPGRPGRFAFSAYQAKRLPQWREGRMSSVADSENDPALDAEDRANYAAFGARAAIGVPLVKHGRFAALLVVNQVRPRAWTEAELALTRDVAERTWTAMEQARAEAALRASEERQAFLLALSDAVRPLAAPEEIARAACRVLVDHLGAARGQFTEVEGGPGDEIGEVRGEYVRVGQPMPRRYPLGPFGEPLVAQMRAGEALTVADADHDPRLTDQQRAMFAAVGSPSAIAIPLVKGGRLVATMAVHGNGPRPWTDREVALVEETAEHTWAAFERARVEAALRESETKYRSLFASIDQGFAILETVRDDAGQLVDLVYREVNPVFARLTGFTARDGLRVRAVMPGIEDEWLAWYDRVALTGEPAIREGFNRDTGRWFRTNASRIGGDGERLAVTFDDVSARKLAEAVLRDSERRQAILLELSDALRPLGEPAEIQAAAMRVLGAGLGVNRAFYGDAQPDGDTLLIGLGYSDGTFPLEGSVSFSAFELDMAEWYRAGHTYVIGDVQRDDRFGAETKASFAAIDVGAAVGVPLVKDGQVRAIVSIHQSAPRDWSDADIALVQEVAERTWAAVERARVETELRRSEELRRVAIAARGMATWRWDVAADRIWCDAAMLKLWDLPPPDAPLRLADFTDRMAPEGCAELGAIVAGAITAGQIFEGDIEISAGRNSGRWVRWRGQVDPDRPTVLNGVSFDITERRATEKALRDSEEQQRLQIELVPALLWWADPCGDAITLNRGWGDYTDQSIAEVQDFGWQAAIHPDDLPETQAAFAHAFAAGEPLERQHRIRKGDNDYRWHLVRHVPVRGDDGAIVRWFGAAIDIHELHEMQQHQRLLVAELQHRVRNILTVIRLTFARTFERGEDIEDMARHFRGRLDAMARTQVLLSRTATRSAQLEDLIRDELLSVGATEETGVTLAGPEVELDGKVAESLGMALHELTTNALKYGALGRSGASLDIRWALHIGEGGHRTLHLSWQERGVPAVSVRPSREGFGRELIEEALPYRIKAETSLEFEGGGVRCSISVPLTDRPIGPGAAGDAR